MRFLAIFTALVAFVSTPAMATEEPQYRVVERIGAVEIREYAPMIVAEVIVRGDVASAPSRGFRPLANYIFGDNAPREDIAMTAPVTAQRRGAEIAMTAPVTAQPVGDDVWTVAFIMPSEWTMESLPEPNDPDVTIRELPAQRMAVLGFRGGRSERLHARMEAELRATLDQAGVETSGEVMGAFYSGPWVPQPFRRNEIWIEVAAP